MTAKVSTVKKARGGLTIEERPLDAVKPYGNNPRVIGEGAVAKVATSISEYGWQQPIVVDAEGFIIVGHTRLQAAKRLGLKTAPVVVAAHLTPAQVRAYRLMDNRSHEESGWDDLMLVEELDALADAGFDLALAGFEEDLESVLDSGDPLGLAGHGADDSDQVPELQAVAITEPGDKWLCGLHRVLCGDSVADGTVGTLLGALHADMAFTDPPWNVAIGTGQGPRRMRAGIENDDLDPEQFAAFTAAFAGVLHAHTKGDVYCVMGASEWPNIDRALRAAGLHWSSTIIWAKDTFVMGRSKYHRRYEPIWYGWPEVLRSSYRAGRDQDDVWECPRPKRSEEHPTMKPVSIVRRAIENSSKVGAIVLDPFVGSGTTIIAAEETGRACYAVDIEPAYVDVAVRRWQMLTGQDAMLAGAGGRSFTDVANERHPDLMEI